MQTGEIDVIGQDQITITLSKDPDEVSVIFKEDNVLTSVPCNPPTFDMLEYELNKDDPKNIKLIIRWKVGGIRTIIWHAYY